VYGLVNALKRESLSALLIRELREKEEIGTGPEEFVADGLILLTRGYVKGHNMRFIEVIKSRGSPHIAIPSLFFFGKGGIRVLPPFQEPFYRFEEAVSTGIADLDDLLGGGIPYGSFYLMEVDADLHQDIFDAGFAKEALEAGDRYVRIAGQSDDKSRWRALMKSAGTERRLRRATENDEVRFLEPDSETLSAELDQLCATADAKTTRIQVDVSRLFAFLPPQQAFTALLDVTARCRQGKAVVFGVVSPRAVPAEQSLWEQIRDHLPYPGRAIPDHCLPSGGGRSPRQRLLPDGVGAVGCRLLRGGVTYLSRSCCLAEGGLDLAERHWVDTSSGL